VRNRLERELEGVPRLRFVCITHFDLDHIRGLARFLKERFSEVDKTGRRIWMIDQIITPIFPTTIGTISKLKEWTRSRSGLRAFASLEEKAEEMSSEMNLLLEMLCEIAVESQKKKSPPEDVPELLSLGVTTYLRGPHGRRADTQMGPWRIACLGPQESTAHNFSGQIMNAFLRSEPLDEVFEDVNANSTSRVLLLWHQHTADTVLLTGDSTTEELEKAMESMQVMENLHGKKDMRFKAVKVSHHGALTCHHPDLYELRCDPAATVAITCAEDDGRHPHQEVVEHVTKHVLSHRVTGKDGDKAFTVNRGTGIPLGTLRRTMLDEREDIKLAMASGRFDIDGGRKSRFDPSKGP
jgi:hypothetical protein